MQQIGKDSKVEGEIVNNVTRLRLVLERGWNVNKKVIGNWYLLLWPPQTLVWWAVDYNKVDALKVILEFPSASEETLQDAWAWSKRKDNNEFAELLEKEITNKRNSTELIELNNKSRLRHYSDDEGYKAFQDNDHVEEEMILSRLDSLRLEQQELASKLEHRKLRSELDFQTTGKELDQKQERFRDLDYIRMQMKESVESSREKFEQARIVYEAALAHFESEERALEKAEREVNAVLKEMDALQSRKSELENSLKKLVDTEKSLSAPIHVDCVKIVMDRHLSKNELLLNKLECPVCRDEEISASFQCGHSFCRRCVDKLYATKRDSKSSTSSAISLNCPMCKTEVKSMHPLFL
jgi:hypothetical protein